MSDQPNYLDTDKVMRAHATTNMLGNMAAALLQLEETQRDILGDTSRDDLRACAKKLVSVATCLAVSVEVTPKPKVADEPRATDRLVLP